MSKQVLSATAFALLIGVSTFTLDTAVAQNGGEARNNDREMKKTLDDKHLTPIRPIRRVGEENWPAAKDQPAPERETTGQSAKQDDKKKEEPAKQEAKQDVKQEPAKQESAKQETPKEDSTKSEQKQEAAKPEAPKADTARQDTAESKPEAKPQEASKEASKEQPQDTAKNANQDNKDAQKNDKGFASIRLGTDASGRVAVNDSQEREITKVIRKHNVDTVNVKVSVGSVAPANVRFVAVSSDMVDVLPQFRGYSYFATREEIVIVEPSTKKVVALIPVKLTATASRPGSDERTTSTESRRTETPRNDPRTSKTAVRERATVGRKAARIDDVPTREEILAAPIARGPAGATVTRTYRSYQYYEPDDDVVIIERRRPRPFGF